MSTVLVIRRWEPADVSRCIQVPLEAHVPVCPSMKEIYGDDLFARLRPDWEAGQAAEIEARVTSPDISGWAAQIDGVVVGFIVLKMDEQSIADIDLLAVDPTMQSRGIATTLNRFALDRSQEASMKYVIVATADDRGHAPARRSYEQAGFVPMPIQWNPQITHL